MQYLQERNKWDSDCITSIDWKAYTQAVSRFGTRRVQITKLCNDLLPTARWANRYSSITTQDCLHCGQPEDRDHLLRCPFPPRLKWRAKLLSDLRHTHSSAESNPYLVDILIDGLHSWMNALHNQNPGGGVPCVYPVCFFYLPHVLQTPLSPLLSSSTYLAYVF
jgi:hypothetical protein